MSFIVIGNMLRDLRKKRGITGTILGEKAGLSQAKISKIENGVNTKLEVKEVTRILNILNAPKTIQQQVFTLLEQAQPNLLETRPYRAFWDQNKTLNVEKEVESVRVFVWALIPALLQTAEYRQAILRTYGLSEEDILGRLKICIDRQELLWDKGHSFHFIIHESALYNTLGTHRIQRVQLSRVERHIGAPNIKIGIIPFMSSLPNIDGHSFSVFGNDQLAIPVVGSEIWSKDAEIIVNHLKAFKQLEHLAHYGDEARDLLYKAIDHFGRSS